MAEQMNLTDFEGNRHLMDLYSRQIGAFGLEAMVKLVQLRVLFVGVSGAGIEAAKNTTLAGAHTVALIDDAPVKMRDLGANFFLTEADIGKPRATVVAARLAELNPLVRVQALQGEPNEDVLRSFDAVVVTDKSVNKETLIRWNEACRSRTKTVYTDRGEEQVVPNPTSFIFCFTGGAFGSVFVDHGPNFIVRDEDGKDPLVKIIKSIEHKTEEITDSQGETHTNHYTLIKFLTPDGQPPGSLPENCLVEITDVEGMVAKSAEVIAKYGASVATCSPWRTSSKPDDPVNSVRIGDTRGFTPYLGGGFLKQVKEPHTLAFRSLAECLPQPSNLETAVFSEINDYGFVMIDLMSMFSPGGVEVQIHFALQAIQAFQMKHGHLPEANNKAHEDECVELATEINTTLRKFAELTPGSKSKVLWVDTLDENIVRKFTRHAAIELQPMCAFFGGVLAQELVKISGRYRPIRQFLNFHALQALPEEQPTDTAPIGSRYDDQIAVFGKAFQEKLGALNIFMVGCGALGCEFIKNFALMGLCCGENGRLHVTDNDRIEISNLSRQFLFREDNVGQPKSEAAAKRAQTMNPAMQITARQDLVSPDTEHIFDDEFWQGIDLVCNALDNMKARLYVDSKCILYEKPLLESGTMGTGANVDVIVPHLTNSYGDGGDAEAGGGIPMCTLRNFPHLIDHCIEWARAKFTDLFVSPATQLQQFLEDPQQFLATLEAKIDQHTGGERLAALDRGVETLKLLQDLVSEIKDKPSMEMCVQMAWKHFHMFFRDMIKDLIATFPADAKTKSGEPFWSGHKIFPKVITFDLSNQLHADFIVSAANLYACVFKVHPNKYPSEENKLHTQRWMAEYRDEAWLRSAVSHLAPPVYVRQNVGDLDEDSKSAAAERAANASEQEEDPQREFDDLREQLLEITKRLNGLAVEPLDFEKDDDDNFHIDFITAAANLRASNYNIPTATRHKCKMIAGRIIPAIATSTASVTGLVMLELYKLLQKKPLESYRNANYDLGANTYFRFEPPAAKKHKSFSIKKLDQSSYEVAVQQFNKFLSQVETKLADLVSLEQRLEAFDKAGQDTKTAVREAIASAKAELEAVADTAPEVDDFMVDEVVVCHPEGFTKWDKLKIPKTLTTLGEIISFFKEEHHLDVNAWFINSKKVYPVKPALDYSKLPSLDMSMNDAMRHIMKVGGAQANALIQAWRKAKASGELPKGDTETEQPTAKTIKRLADEAGLDTKKKKLLVFTDVALANADGVVVTTPPVVVEL
eukprot:m.55979 g.55979  ORF g.55979 m.55979 type:complete len:1262 (-) comp12981_c0_seq1:328-4113(-)